MKTLRHIIWALLVVWTPLSIFAQSQKQEESKTYKKRVLESAEIDLLSSYYQQEGGNASVTGGIGDEQLTNFANNITVNIPVKSDGVLSIDGTISAYSSASSSNLNPFTGASSSYGNSYTPVSGASSGSRGKGRNPANSTSTSSVVSVGSPWVTTYNVARNDVLRSGNLGYTHYSADRNRSIGGNFSISREYDYASFGGGLSFSQMFNQKNTEIGLKANAYLDHWLPQSPAELTAYLSSNGNLNTGIFQNLAIYDAQGRATSKTSLATWSPLNNSLLDQTKRNTYSLSFNFSQILSKNLQIALLSDIVYQEGWLANPMQRVYFADRANYYVGSTSGISQYEEASNRSTFQLADDIERLPDTRLKLPLGMRLNYYISENFTLRTYYRYYLDTWGLNAHTFKVELPIKLADHFTLYPSYRYYKQNAATYFAPFEQHLSTETYYTSDYDLSAYSAQQFGFGVKYTDIFTSSHVLNWGIKSVSLNYDYYTRNIPFTAHIVTFGLKFVLDK